MTTLLDGSQLLQIAYGAQVTKTAQALPSAATGNLFTVAGGRVIVTSIVGTVSTVFGGVSGNLTVGVNPTTGSAGTAAIASALVTGTTAVGSLLYPASFGGALTANTGGAGGLILPFVVSAGTITLTTSAASTGAVTWELTYIPLDTGASVS